MAWQSWNIARRSKEAKLGHFGRPNPPESINRKFQDLFAAVKIQLAAVTRLWFLLVAANDYADFDPRRFQTLLFRIF